MARCGKLTGTSLPDSACCTDGESNVVGDCKSRQIERAYQGKQGGECSKWTFLIILQAIIPYLSTKNQYICYRIKVRGCS